MNKPIKILIVEDDPFILSMYSTKLVMENFNIVCASDGLEGIEMAKREIPDIILLDIMLPKRNGFEVLKAVKDDVITKNIPVIMLTNLNQEDECNQGMTLGAADYLIKAHCLPSEVVQKIKLILKI
jgi:DNA-binding response OmpR family regulator